MSNKQESKKSAEEIERYWTPERKAKAKLREFKPTPAPKPDPAPVTPEGKQLDIPGHNPDEKEGDKGASPAAPENAAPVTNPTQYPWRTVGKLYFIAGGIDYVGTAYSIYTNTLLTAAHNLYKDGVWSEILYFVPALLSTGVEPFGHWTYYRETVMPDWMNNQSPAYDVGTVWLNVGGNTNQPIGGVVGYLGLTYNRTVPREWVDTAYPGGEMQMYADP
jgi:V8-like Glu-specific endopeptidase